MKGCTMPLTLLAVAETAAVCWLCLADWKKRLCVCCVSAPLPCCPGQPAAIV